VLRAVALAVAAAGAIALYYAASVHAQPASSDAATIMLEGQAMAAGHLTLHGWSLSLDSWWTIDAVGYTIAVLVGGFHQVILDLVPAAVALGLLATGGLLARDGRKGAAGWAGVLTIVALIGLPGHVMSIYLLKAGLHSGTALLCLLAFVALRTLRFDRRWCLAVVALAAGILGDFQALSLGVVPVMAAGLVTAARHRHLRSGLPALAAGPAAIVLAGAVRLAAQLVGTYALVSPQPHASSLHQVAANIAHIATMGAAVLGVGSTGYGTGGVPAALQAIHVVGLAVVVVAILVALYSTVNGAARGQLADGAIEPGFLDDVLVLAVIGDLVTFVFLSASSSPAYGRYLMAGAVFGSILAGRLVANLATSFATRLASRPRPFRAALPAAGLAVTAVFASGVGFNLAQPAPANPTGTLGSFLAAHDLHLGIGDYWTSSITTVITDGSIVVRPVIVKTSDGDIVPYGRSSDSSWYTGTPFQFLVYNSALPFGGVGTKSAEHTFGKPTHIYRVGTYYVLTFARPITLSAPGWY
jgi:hypothetical protein